MTSNFSLFPTVFSTHLENHLPFSSNLELSSANSFSLKESKICHLGKGSHHTREHGSNTIIGQFSC